jgi:DNA-binding transcriptional LysR family regulator
MMDIKPPAQQSVHDDQPASEIRSMQKRVRELGLGDWDDVRVFLAVTRSGSFSRAAEMLGATQSTVSRRIQSLEERLGAKLFDRHAQGMRPTPAARAVIRRAELMETQAQSIERALVGSDMETQGSVRITGTEGILSCWLVPRLLPFREDFPEIRIELIIADKPLNLGAREADIALRFGRPGDPRLISRELGQVHFGLFAARSYLERCGQPESFTDLREHAILNHSNYYDTDTDDVWRRLIDDHAQLPLYTNSSISYLHAVRHGLGIGLLPLYIDGVAPELVSLDLNIGYVRDLFMVTHRETDKRARIQALTQYVKTVAEQGLHQWFI